MKHEGPRISRSAQRLPAKHHSKKSLGQNFLVDNSVIAHIIDAVHPRTDETIIEIGPGRGALTERLVEKAGQLVAIEFDRDLIARLQPGFHLLGTFGSLKAMRWPLTFVAFLNPTK